MTQTNESHLRGFVERHRSLLAKEREAEIARTSLLLSNCGPKLLERKGLALGGLSISNVTIGLGGKTLVELERSTAYHSSVSFPPHTFRTGDLARVEENVSSNASTKKPSKPKKDDAKRSKAPEGVVYKVSDSRIVIAIDTSDSAEELDLPERCRVLKLANSVTYDRMEKTLAQLEKIVLPDSSSSPPASLLLRVLLGLSPPSERMPIQDLVFFDQSLNPSQQEAVRFALESPEVACIHGPPGTGKTHTLIEIIRQLTTVTPANPKPLRILICGASNLSVDNILERLLALSNSDKSNGMKLTRLGHPARVMANEGVIDSTLEAKANRSEEAALAKDVKNELEATLSTLSGKGKGAKAKAPRGLERKKMWDDVRALRKEYRQREGKVVETVMNGSQVVLATCHSAGGWQIRNHVFDVAIIDEATQALEAVCWIPVLKAKKLILAGDPMQLPPTIISIDKPKKDKTKGSNSKNTDTKSTKATPKTTPDLKQEGGEEVKKSDAPEADEPESSDDDELGDAELESDHPVPDTVHEDKPKPTKEKSKKRERQHGVLRPPRTLETTMFDRLEKMYGASIKRMLTVQYRMHEHIATFPSKTMYYSKLTSHASVASHLLQDLPNTNADSPEEETEVLGTPVVFFDTAGCEYFERLEGEGDGDEGSRCNENEVMVVKMWTERLISTGVLPSQIAIITPYQAQVSLLTSLLRPTYGTDLEIGTVDGIQGREKDAVIISLVRSNENHEVGFLKDKRRLNVAMTRAKRHLCVIGDSSTVQHGSPFLKKWISWLENNADVRYAGLD